MKKRIFSILLCCVMLVGLLPTVALAEGGVSYLDETGTSQTCASATEVTSSDTGWTTGWYVVQGTVEIGSRVTVSGDVHLILTDGCTLTVNGGIQVQDNDNNPDTPSTNALTIYGQANGTGKLTTRDVAINDAAIGGNGVLNEATVSDVLYVLSRMSPIQYSVKGKQIRITSKSTMPMKK